MSWWETLLDLGTTAYGAYQSKEAAKDTREVNMEDIVKLLGISDQINNPNVRGLFGGWENSFGEDGRLVQTQTVNPGMLPGMNGFVDRFNEGPQTGQYDALANARFASLMGNQGPKPPPERRQRPALKAHFQDDQGNSIPGYTKWGRTG